MPLTASKTDTCTMARARDEAMGETFAVRRACWALWFHSVITSALAVPHKIMARSPTTALSARFPLTILLFMVILLFENFERGPCAGWWPTFRLRPICLADSDSRSCESQHSAPSTKDARI